MPRLPRHPRGCGGCGLHRRSPVITSPWNTLPPAVADGAYVICVSATDPAAHTGMSAVVPVTVDNTLPTGAITAPIAGASVRGTIPLTSTAARRQPHHGGVDLDTGSRERARGGSYDVGHDHSCRWCRDAHRNRHRRRGQRRSSRRRSASRSTTRSRTSRRSSRPRPRLPARRPWSGRLLTTRSGSTTTS